MTGFPITGSTEEWSTPPAIFDPLVDEFGNFDLDPAAADWNAKCPEYYTKREDGLAQGWYGNVFLNPPYGQRGRRSKIEPWVKKAEEEVKRSAVDRIVALLPARTDNGWFHEYIYKTGVEVRFLRGRIYFIDENGKTGRSPCGSMIVIWE